MTSQIIPVEAFDYVVFGGTGDLSERKLIPALYRRSADGQITAGSRIIGASRAEMSHEEFRKFADNAIRSHVHKEEIDEAKINDFVAMFYYISLDAISERGWEPLAELLGDDDRVRAYYLAVGPALFGDFAQRLHTNGLIREHSRLVIEKPIGTDLKSAQELNEIVGKYFREEQIYRIDHYLGKETVQNLMALRFANALYEPLWNSAHVDHVQITVAETLGVEGRGGYYDKSGAIRDMVQNHLLQLLCLVAMEPPATMDGDAVRDEKLKVLRSLEPINPANVGKNTVRGQYSAGADSGVAVPAYLDEIEDKDSNTATFVALKANIQNWRWAGVPFYLRTGKRMATRLSEIVIQFKPAPHNIFSKEAGRFISNRLVLRLQPDEGVKQWIMIKDPGPGGMRLRHVSLDMSFAASFDAKAPDAYERLLLDVIRGNPTLFMRRDEVEAAWRWIDPIVEAWDGLDEKPKKYVAGTWGPSDSVKLISHDDRTWHEEHDEG